MGCCGTNTTGAGAVAVDTNKRVNYTKGMLLGVDDFVQEQAWHIARRHELAREVLGYGTVRGLNVEMELDGGSPPAPAPAPVVRVSPGLAYLPSGAPVCVGSEQCCDINAWLAKHWAELPAEVNGAVQPAPLRLHVVLSGLAVPTDPLPVPGEPCRDEDELTANSRIADCFKLELRLKAPEQIEEDAIRDFADWLAQVPLASSSPPMDEAAWLAALRSAALDWLQPVSPNPADYMFGSPPASLGSSDALLQAALRLWVTELRPLWRARYGCGPLPTATGGPDDAVLLATLDLQVFAVDKRAEPDVAIVEDARPVLLSLRLVQELITQNPAPEPASSVEPALGFGMAAVVGTDSAYARADHHHGTPTLPPPPVLAGDAVGPIAGNEVVALRGVPLAAVLPQDDEALVFQGGQWQPTALPVAGAAVVPALQFALPASDGAASGFARADHSHGTPSLRGDAVAVDSGSPAVQQVRVRGLDGVPLDLSAPLAAGQVLTVQGTGSSLRWRPVTPPVVPAPPPVPVPGPVQAQLAFGLPPADGSSSNFARADHSHGTPALTGDVLTQGAGSAQQARVVRLQGRDLSNAAPVTRQVLTFNGSAWAPADLPAGGTPVPPLGGDLSGPVGAAFVESLQRVPLKAQAPARGDVLTFDGRSWVPGAAAGGATAAIEIIAAGVMELNLQASPNSARVSVSAGRDSAKLSRTLANQAEVEITAAGITDARGPRKGFMVKLTPVWNEKSPLLAYLAGVRVADADALQVDVVLFSQDFGREVYEVHYEISRYQPFDAR